MNTGIKLRNDFQLSSIFIIKLTTSIPNNCITTKTVTVATTLPVKLGSLINISVEIHKPILSSNKSTPIPRPESKNQ